VIREPCDRADEDEVSFDTSSHEVRPLQPGRGDRTSSVPVPAEAHVPSGSDTCIVPAPRPANERERLEALRLYDVLDTPPEQAFDDIARLAAHICDAPIASISLIDAERQWFKAKIGIPVCETARDEGFCAYTILQDDLFVIADTTEDTRFARHPLVRGGPEIRFYAGAPLIAPSGHRIGALAVNDTVARGLTEAQQDALRALSRQTVDQFELRRALAQSRREALTDALTSLGNRRRLLIELGAELERATLAEPITLVFLDLDGFKLYNDTFGHAAGDTLLSRLAAKLTKTVEKHGKAYRMGGDEFCVLLHGDVTANRRLMSGIVLSLSERGEGFVITSSQGIVVLPLEATDVSHALTLADERMYRQKNVRPGSVMTQTADVISCIVSEHAPDLYNRSVGVTELARTLGVKLGLAAADLDELVHAAGLHDIGKMAIPEAILSKPSPLSGDEWAFMRRHTVIGERILAAAPALRTVAAIVRSTHECWDGTGYPDGLCGDEIPLASRAIFICDSFAAMTVDRPHRRALGISAALAELHRCAGTQFDPALVEAFSDDVIPLHVGLQGARKSA
jgi:diguanylate cyclase (GGDEF)-like protein